MIPEIDKNHPQQTQWSHWAMLQQLWGSYAKLRRNYAKLRCNYAAIAAPKYAAITQQVII